MLDTILRNVEVADSEKNLVCQDTGIAVYYCRVGEGFPLHPARIYEALRDGTGRATVEHPLRSNTVHTITRQNTGQNVGYRVPIVHWDFVPGWDGMDVLDADTVVLGNWIDSRYVIAEVDASGTLSVPSVYEMPSGCRFAPRCGHVEPPCLKPQELVASRDWRHVRCRRAGELSLPGAAP